MRRGVGVIEVISITFSDLLGGAARMTLTSNNAPINCPKRNVEIRDKG